MKDVRLYSIRLYGVVPSAFTASCLYLLTAAALNLLLRSGSRGRVLGRGSLLGGLLAPVRVDSGRSATGPERGEILAAGIEALLRPLLASGGTSVLIRPTAAANLGGSLRVLLADFLRGLNGAAGLLRVPGLPGLKVSNCLFDGIKVGGGVQAEEAELLKGVDGEGEVGGLDGSLVALALLLACPHLEENIVSLLADGLKIGEGVVLDSDDIGGLLGSGSLLLLLLLGLGVSEVSA